MKTPRTLTTKIPTDANCGTCRWHNQRPRVLSQCRRYAPVVTTRSILAQTVWPETKDNDWCGEWEATIEEPEAKS
jgi:hypothetical protein